MAKDNGQRGSHTGYELLFGCTSPDCPWCGTVHRTTEDTDACRKLLAGDNIGEPGGAEAEGGSPPPFGVK